MPLYEFHCPKCHHSFEELLSVRTYEKEAATMPCPECFYRAVERVYRGRMLLNTATAWLAKQKTVSDQFSESPEGRRQMMERIQAAQRAGRSVSMHDVWDGTVASAPDDPDGWIPHDDPAGHIRRVAAKRGVGCNGSLCKVAAPMADPGPPKPMPDDLVTDHVKHAVKKNPDLAHGDQKKLREAIRETHSFHKE